jgi:hypothetical protein
MDSIHSTEKIEELDSILKKGKLDRINRIIRIKRPSAEGRIAAGEKKIPEIL